MFYEVESDADVSKVCLERNY